MKRSILDKKNRAAVEKFAETFSKLPLEAQKDVALYALAAKAIYESKEIKEDARGSDSQ